MIVTRNIHTCLICWRHKLSTTVAAGGSDVITTLTQFLVPSTRASISHSLYLLMLQSRVQCYKISVLGPGTQSMMSLSLCAAPVLLTLDVTLLDQESSGLVVVSLQLLLL